jgi:vacuolar-type H+-ATPase subunit H
LKKVKYDNLEITNIKGKIIAKNGIAKLEKIFMELLGGSTEMNGSYTAVNKSEPKADFSLLFKNFDIPTLYKSFVTIKKFTPIAEYCSGKINGNISLQTVLDNEMMPVYNTLDSKGTFSSDNIGIKNNKIFNAIADKTKYKEFADPVLKDVEISYTMDDGNITIKPTNFKIAGIKTTFGGNQKIDGAIDYKTDLELPSKFAANVLSKIPGDSPANISVSVKIGGTVDNPKITGFGSNLTDNLKDKTLDVIEKYTGVDKEKAKEILESAQKKADALILEAKNQADKIRKEADNAGKLLISEAKKQGDKLISQATNPITKKAAQLTADKLVKEAEDKAKALNVEADKKATQLTDKAKLEADKIIESANQQVEKL